MAHICPYDGFPLTCLPEAMHVLKTENDAVDSVDPWQAASKAGNLQKAEDR